MWCGIYDRKTKDGLCHSFIVVFLIVSLYSELLFSWFNLAEI